MNGNWQYIERHLSHILEQEIHFSNISSISGGCINQAWKVNDNSNRSWFIKTNHAHQLSMFEAEYQGLEALYNSNSIRVPKPIHYGVVKKHCYLVMEYIPLHGRDQPCLMGKQLAQMHLNQADLFGWIINNTIGSTQQRNKQNNNWVSFWKYERLRHQLDLALHNGLSQNTYEKGFQLSENIDMFFSSYQPKASLLHGDLWGGNIAYDEQNHPVIFDPAVYYGDHEADLAMTELFGSLGTKFYDCYHEHFPIDSGYNIRKTLYNLYHVLNHYNLFGGGYGSQAEKMIDMLLSEIKE